MIVDRDGGSASVEGAFGQVLLFADALDSLLRDLCGFKSGSSGVRVHPGESGDPV